ncbi:hypothetical protein EVAR_31058_1 [Eumeta japonica]|uniref:Uncharacterized protein n=1 Tax=Eumeta variegata TaxID=151549 RepID=A0A4C1VET1_EUMVA|nr:hypothetical protein EVAR_31058_1 [Eumeta japonica]
MRRITSHAALPSSAVPRGRGVTRGGPVFPCGAGLFCLRRELKNLQMSHVAATCCERKKSFEVARAARAQLSKRRPASCG